MAAMLSGVRVVDLSSVLLGPYCTQGLADLGADVIKVETAKWRPLSSSWTFCKDPWPNGPCAYGDEPRKEVCRIRSQDGGRSKTPRGACSKTANVFIHNLRHEAIARLNLDYDSVRGIRPDVIYVHCTGYGSGGPYSGKPAYDDVIQAASGLAALLNRVDNSEAPRYLPTAIADKVSGLHALYAVLAALFHHARTGEGQFIEVPMLESITAFTLAEHLFGMTFVPPNGKSRDMAACSIPIGSRSGHQMAI